MPGPGKRILNWISRERSVCMPLGIPQAAWDRWLMIWETFTGNIPSAAVQRILDRRSQPTKRGYHGAGPSGAAGYASLAPKGLQQALDVIQRAQELLPKARMKRSDRSLIIQEYELVIRLLQHACQRIKLVSIQDTVEAVDLRHELYEDLQEILGLFTYVWLERNRPGGLADSRKGLEKLLDDYLVDIQQ